jgi:hypothetical protein
MAQIVSVTAYREWAGASVDNVSDALISVTLDESEAGIEADIGVTAAELLANSRATALAWGEEVRRTSRLLARRNSPESISGQGEFAIMIPSRDPDSARTLTQIRQALGIGEVIA